MVIPTAVTGALGTAWAFIKRFYREIAIVLLLLTARHFQSRATHWHDQTQVCQSGREADRQAFAKAAADAKAKNLAEVREIEKRWQATVTATEEKYDAQLAAARADVAVYVERLRKAYAANSGGVGNSGVSLPAGTSGATPGAGGATLIPVPEGDLYICAANTVKAEQWQVFYSGLRTSWPPATKPPE